MKVTFVTPPVLVGNRPAERSAGCTHVVYPMPNIYELIVAAVVEDKPGCDVRYRDFSHHRDDHEWRQWLDGDDSDIYMVWMVNLSLKSDLLATAAVHELRPEAHVVFLGPGATYFIRKTLVHARNIVVRGEPEATVSELIDVLAAGKPLDTVDGISYLNDSGEVVNNRARALITDLDTLPFPARHLLGERRYHNPKLKCDGYTTALTSRNCPFKCIYCVPSSLTFAREIEHRKHNDGRKPLITMRSVESVDREMRMLHEQGYKAVGFVDDNFIWNEERTRGLCEVMRRYGMVWGCQARVDAITPAIAQMLSESGCRYIDLGVESFDDEILAYIKKGITSKQIYDAINTLKRYGVPVKLNILIGCCPLETRETVRHTLREAKRLKVDQVMFNIVSPFPGTEFYKLCKENGWLATGKYEPTDVQRNSIVNFPHLTAREMERELQRNNLSYFLSWHFISTHIGRFTSVGEFVHAARALKRKLFG